jgi:hypothetical protein
MRWPCHTPTYMKERTHTVATEAETVPVTAGLRHQSGNVDVVSFHLTIVLHLSDKKGFGVAFQERSQGETGALRAIRQIRKYDR